MCRKFCTELLKCFDEYKTIIHAKTPNETLFAALISNVVAPWVALAAMLCVCTEDTISVFRNLFEDLGI